GSWVYDSGHQPRGWNEIHPIKFCSPIGHYSATIKGNGPRTSTTPQPSGPTLSATRRQQPPSNSRNSRRTSGRCTPFSTGASLSLSCSGANKPIGKSLYAHRFIL